MSNSNLEFRKIPSLKFLYEVNSNGTIFRNVKSKKQSKIKLDMHHSEKGYYTTFVHIGGRKPDAYTKRIPIHRVVAECWLGPCPEGMQVDHIDRNTHNNDYRNLRYVTVSEQMRNRDHSKIRLVGSRNLEIYRDKQAAMRELRCLQRPVMLKKDDFVMSFSSLSSCADYIVTSLNKKRWTVLNRLKMRRKHIYGYDVIYLNAETVHTGSTEQETVHESDLSYENRFNSAKMAELNARVTHA